MGESEAEPYYRVLLDKSEEEIKQRLEDLKAAIQAGKLKHIDFNGLKTVWFKQHLYQPLLCLEQNVIEISPAPLNKGEQTFVEDLKIFHTANGAFFADKELYLLRNLSKGRGVGFFEAGNFHPDFILWLLVGGKQYIVFVDPKGIRNLGVQDPKIGFYKTVKEIENRLSDTKVRLESFIVSNTSSRTMEMLWSMKKAELAERHILFQIEDKETYMRTLIESVIAA